MSKKISLFVIFFALGMLNNIAFADPLQISWDGDPPAPFNKSFIQNPQSFVSLFGVDLDSPPDKLDVLTSYLISRSNGGSTVYWSSKKSVPSAITTKIPAPNGVSDVLIVLQELAEVYGITDVNQELEVRVQTFDNFSDIDRLFPPNQYIVFQHVCKFSDGTQVDVENLEFS
ncbi:MAG: hypothetical protein AAFQ94_29455, partial [Bacteroidota bacterium]